jgi:hypothetical protein
MSIQDNCDERCPGCQQGFTDDDVTGMLGDPGTPGMLPRKWHLACHQRVYFQALSRCFWPNCNCQGQGHCKAGGVSASIPRRHDPVIIPDMETVEGLDALARLGGSLTVDQGAAEIFDELRKIALAYISRTRQVEDMMNFILATYIVNVRARAKDGDAWCAQMDAWALPQLERLKLLRTTVVTEQVND